jgi:DNA polymerase-3 subunit delta'
LLLSDNYNNIVFDKQLAQLFAGGLERLPHAMLLTGQEGVGKTAFAIRLAHLLLCESPQAYSACASCQACRWLSSDNHPDFRHVKPDSEDEGEEGAKEKTKKRGQGIIRIDQIRELESFVFIGSHRMGARVVLLTEAETMNGPAANALLKILEEPPASVYFILVSSRQKSLLPTIRSRCQSIPFSVPEAALSTTMLANIGPGNDVARYLDLAAGAPLRVAKWSEAGLIAPLNSLIEMLQNPPADPIGLAARWDGLLKSEPGFTLEHLVEELQRWLFDLAQERLTGSMRYHAGWPRSKVSQVNFNPVALMGAWRQLMQFRRSSRHPLNQLLFLESLAAHFLRALRPDPI